MISANHTTPSLVVAFGANLGSRQETIDAALEAIAERVGSIEQRSAIRETAPLVLPGADPTEYPNYLNGVVRIRSALQPREVLDRLLEIELELGRNRGTSKRWASRTIDLDLICVEQLIIASPALTLPHPEMHKRTFVLEPFCDVWSEWEHPILKRSARELLESLRPEA